MRVTGPASSMLAVRSRRALSTTSASRRVRMPVRVLRDRAYYAPDAWKGLVDESDPDALVPIVTSPDRIILVVAGRL